MNIKFLLPLFFLPLIATAQHIIKGTFSPPQEYTWAILYKVTPNGTKYAVDSKIKEDGSISLYLKAGSETGIYRLVYGVPQETYNFDVIYNAKEDIVFKFDLEEGVTFIESEENELLQTYQSEMQAIRLEIEKEYINGYASVSRLFEELKDKQLQFEKESKETIAQHFIQANRPYIPGKSETLSDYIKNSKTEYFTNIDFNDAILQASKFLTEYSFNYILGFVNQNEIVASTYANIDTVNGHLQDSDSAYQQAFLHELWKKFVNQEKISTANYISEKYLIPISELLKDDKLVRELTVFKNLSIGVKSPNFSWENEELGKPKSQSLYNLKGAEKYIIIFWSSGCSHCLKEIPELYNSLQKIDPTKLKVIAIGIEDEPTAWENKIKEFPKFIHVLGLGKWENQIGNDYDVNATPTYFVLDKNKTILAKPSDIEELMKIILEKSANY